MVGVFFLVVLVGIIALLSVSIRILKEYERGVVFRLGRCVGIRGPGLILLIPVLEQMTTVPLRTVATEIPAQDVVTKDNVTIKVTAVVYSKVVDPQKAIIEVERYAYALAQLAQTALRGVKGELQASEKLAEAAAKLSETPGALQLRTLQTMTEISAEKNSTILFPYELMNTVREALGKKE